MRSRPPKRTFVVGLVGAVLAMAGSVAAVAVGDGSPPGATAICKDGTYSYSQTRSGTCSHHGGVAVWLTGGSSTTTPTVDPPPTTADGPVVTTSTQSDQLSPHCQFLPGDPQLNYGPGLANFFPFAYAYLGSLTSITVSYGDGSPQVNLSLPLAPALMIQHTYASNGSYSASISCVDDAGRTASSTITFTVSTVVAVPVSPTVSATTTTTSATTTTPSTTSAPAPAGPSCTSGYTSANIAGAHRCLRAGEFCTHAYDVQYRQYGFRCVKYDATVRRYRLTHA